METHYSQLIKLSLPAARKNLPLYIHRKALKNHSLSVMTNQKRDKKRYSFLRKDQKIGHMANHLQTSIDHQRKMPIIKMKIPKNLEWMIQKIDSARLRNRSRLKTLRPRNDLDRVHMGKSILCIVTSMRKNMR
jgi:hypothetical protein